MGGFTLQILSDRAEISDVFNKYALALDTRNWDLFRSIFTEDAVADLSSLQPGVIFSGAEELVAYARRTISALEVTQHMITNHSHDIDGDTAKCMAYLHGQHVAKNDIGELIQCVLGGYYCYDMARTATGWKIKKYSLNITWSAGNGAELGRALEKAKNA